MEGESPLESPGFTVKKKVDETWKKSVEKEKAEASPASRPPQPPPAHEPAGGAAEEREPEPAPDPGKPDFLYFLSGLGMQTLAALGEIPDDSGVALPPDLGQAKYLIDVLEMLAAKTKGNLSSQEKASFEQLLYQLRVKFVQKSRAAAAP